MMAFAEVVALKFDVLIEAQSDRASVMQLLESKIEFVSDKPIMPMPEVLSKILAMVSEYCRYQVR